MARPRRGRALGRSARRARGYAARDAAKLFATSARELPRAAVSIPSTSAPRSAGTRSRTRWRGPRRRGPPTACCTSTPRARSAGRPGVSSAAAWARSRGHLRDAAREAGATIAHRGGGRADRRRAPAACAACSLAGGGELAAPHRALERRSEAHPARARRARRASTPRPSRRFGAYRCEGASMKINLAVGELPRIAGTPPGCNPHHRGLIQLTLPLDRMDLDQEAARRGSRRSPRTSSSASRASLDPTSRPRTATSSRSGFDRSPTGSRTATGTRCESGSPMR